MEPSTIQIFLFGDQTSAFETDLRQLLHVKDNGILTSFLTKANFALRLAITKLPPSQQELFPRFSTLIDLLNGFHESGSHPALQLGLLCLNQLARFINYYGEGSRPYPHPSKSFLVGLCTGSLAAAAISTSRTVSELVPAAIEAVLVAFRTGLRSVEVRQDIEPNALNTSSWSMTLAIHEEQASLALREHAKATALPSSSQPYISAVGTNNVTISGPPVALKQLLQISTFSSLKPLVLPVHAPYHAAHLYGDCDVDAILASADTEILGSYKPRIPLVSSASAKIRGSDNYGSLLQAASRDILINQLRWDSVLNGCRTAFNVSNPSTRYEILPILTNSAPSLCAALSQIPNVEAIVDESLVDGTSDPKRSSSGAKLDKSKLAIIGHSGRFPDAASSQKFWELLHKGLDVHREVPKDRFDGGTHYDPTGKKRNTSKVQYGCWIEEPGLFDARFFHMSPREAANTDPAQRLAIMTAYEALEMAGIVPNRTPSTQRDRVGIFYGMTSDDWREVNSGQDIDTYFIPGGSRAFTPGRINYHFKFSGPSLSIDTACSSSFAAIHTACNSLWRNECDTAIAGGTNVMTNPDNFAGLDRGHFLSQTGNCKTFDNGADGYCRADAVGTIILKRLEDAEADNDPIYGVILDAATNHSADADSMTRPHAGAQAALFKKSLSHSNVNPLDVSYIEMHGTGTQAGDAVEMKSVLEVFAKGVGSRGAQYPLYLGSAKSNVGHAESASGVTSLIKVLMMMERDEVPPHCGIKTKINEKFPTDLKARNVNIALEPTSWRRPDNGRGNRTVFLNNFSAAGGNTALLMQDAPAVAAPQNNDPRSIQPVAISAKSQLSLQKNIDSLISFMDNHSDLSVPALSYTTTARRTHHNYRAMVGGQDIKAIKQALLSLPPATEIKPIPVANKIPGIAFAFTGQGSLYTGMARELFDSFPQFRDDLERFDRMAQNQGFPTFLWLINGTMKGAEVSPAVSQLAIVCVQIALTKLWRSWGVHPSAVIGHSLGEYAALYAAGVLSASSVIFLVGTRAQLMERKCVMGTHAMLAIKASLSSLQQYLVKTDLEVSCLNGPTDTVIGGKGHEIDALASILKNSGVKCVQLEVPFAFHTSQVEPLLDEFEECARGVVFNKPSINFISPLLGEVVEDSSTFGPSYLRRACLATVNFQSALISANDAKIVNNDTQWIEIGSHPLCSGMIKSVLGSQVTTLATLRRNSDAWSILVSSLTSLHLKGIEIQWNEYHRDFPDCHSVIQLPAYNWDAKNHWIQYRNDFCLTKGDKPDAIVSATPEPISSPISTISVQKVVEQQLGEEKSTIIIESDLAEPRLARVMEGHKVNGVTLCPSSLYADIALTIGDYLLKATDAASTKVGMNVADMVVDKTLIATTGISQLLRASGSADWRTRRLTLQFYCVNADRKTTSVHARCTVKFGDSEAWLKDWKRNAYLIRSRIKSLHSDVEEGQSHKMKRGMIYKLFSSFVEYGPTYQGMQEVVFDSTGLEATARVQFQTTQKDEDFFLGPYWIDNLGHLSGFVMNANDGMDLKSQVFINHGWESMHVASTFSREKNYQTYVKMQNIEGTLFSGDVYMFDGDEVVGLNQGVKFQGVPRKVLDHLLPGTRAVGASSQTAKPTNGAPKSKSSALSVAAATRMPTIKGPLVVEKRSTIAVERITKSASNGITFRAMKLIAEETGLDTSELTPGVVFADIGVDSLLSLNITGRIREELDLDVDQSLFVDCPTVKDMTSFLDANGDVPADTPGTTACATPESDLCSEDSQSEASTEPTDVEGDDSDVMALIRRTLATEIGLEEEEITDSLPFAEMGVDSLLSLTILGKLREEIGSDLSMSFFVDNTCLLEVSTSLGLKPKAAVSARDTSPQLATTTKNIINASVPPASSILLQGNPKTASRNLFLFPDGSGSATSYAPLPRIDPDVAVFGLNCPYMKNPQDMKCGIEDITPRYLEEIRRRQPTGPYYFGGWSAGGVCAFDAAQHLDRLGEEVVRLILIDSPYPIGLEKLPPRLYDFFNSIGLFGTGDKAPPSWLLPHFLAFVDSLDRYEAVPFKRGHAPRTHLIWARDGVSKHPGDPRPHMDEKTPKEMKWLVNNRTDFGSNGWEGLLGGDPPVIETMHDANHFTMMAGSKVQELAAFVRRAMA